jgi:hypothetical protein
MARDQHPPQALDLRCLMALVLLQFNQTRRVPRSRSVRDLLGWIGETVTTHIGRGD